MEKRCRFSSLTKGVWLFLILILCCPQLKAQREPEKRQENEENKNSLSHLDFEDRLVFGGNLGLSFGSRTSINVSPKIGYRLNKRWMAGIGFTYNYIKIKDRRRGIFYEDHIYGGQLFTNYRVFQNFLAIGKMELMNVRTQPNLFQNQRRVWQPGTFLGLGYRQGVGGKVALDLQLLYNFSYRPGISPYNSPWVFQFNIFVF